MIVLELNKDPFYQNIHLLSNYFHDLEKIEDNSSSIYLNFQENTYSKFYPNKKFLLKFLIIILINQHNPLILQEYYQKLQNFLSQNFYAFNFLSFFHNLLAHYPKIEKILPNLKNDFFTPIPSKIALLPIINHLNPLDYNFQRYYYYFNYRKDRYLNYFKQNDLLFKLAFAQQKITPLIFHLIKRFHFFLEKSAVYSYPLILYRGIHRSAETEILKKEIGEQIKLSGFRSQTFAYQIANHFSIIGENYGVILELHYPANLKYLCFNLDEKEVLISPDQYFRIKNKYVNHLNIICQLEYVKNEEFLGEINLEDFDAKFFEVLKILNDAYYNQYWIGLYLYFLQNKNILEDIFKKYDLKIEKIEDGKYYLEDYENRINDFTGNMKDLTCAFKSCLLEEKNRNILSNKLNILNLNQQKEIEEFIQKYK